MVTSSFNPKSTNVCRTITTRSGNSTRFISRRRRCGWSLSHDRRRHLAANKDPAHQRDRFGRAASDASDAYATAKAGLQRTNAVVIKSRSGKRRVISGVVEDEEVSRGIESKTSCRPDLRRSSRHILIERLAAACSRSAGSVIRAKRQYDSAESDLVAVRKPRRGRDAPPFNCVPFLLFRSSRVASPRSTTMRAWYREMPGESM